MTYEYAPNTDRYARRYDDWPLTTGRRRGDLVAVTTRARRRPAPPATGPIIIAALSVAVVVVLAFAAADYNRSRFTPSQARALALTSVRQLPDYELNPSYFELLMEQSRPRAWRLACEENQERLSLEQRQRLYVQQLLRRMADIAQNEGQTQAASACMSSLGE